MKQLLRARHVAGRESLRMLLDFLGELQKLFHLGDGEGRVPEIAEERDRLWLVMQEIDDLGIG